MMINHNILRLAVYPTYKDLPLGEIREFDTVGVPGVSRLRVVGRVGGISIVGVDDEKLASPVVLLHPRWTRIEGGLEEEPAWIGGREGRQLVDTSMFCWKMVCGCGRVRYSKANSRHQVKACRICTKQQQLQRRASLARRRRRMMR